MEERRGKRKEEWEERKGMEKGNEIGYEKGGIGWEKGEGGSEGSRESKHGDRYVGG